MSRNINFFFESVVILVFFFFFQAEDGIRDYKVTGVQTCALPIYAIRQLQRQPGDQGLYHLVAGGETTWHAYADHVIAKARELAPEHPWMVQRIAAVPTSAFPTPAQRPHNSRLNTERLQQTFGLRLPHWQAGVDRMLQEII